jgi:hypothetical protein
MTALGLGLSGQLNLSPRKQRRQPFAPNRLSGLAFWYDADDSSYVGGTWGDLSGQGNDATQPTASKRPTKTTDTAGRTLLRFDGVDDVLSVSTPPSFASGLTFFIVYRVRTAVDFQGIFSASAATGADHQQFFSLEYEQALSRRVQVFGRSAQPNQVFVEGVDSTQAQYAIVTFDDDAINVELRDLNGIRGDISTAVAFGTPAAIVLGARYNAGAPFGFGAVDRRGRAPRCWGLDQRHIFRQLRDAGRDRARRPLRRCAIRLRGSRHHGDGRGHARPVGRGSTAAGRLGHSQMEPLDG